MKKTLIIAAAFVLVLSSCGTYAGSGAYAGAGLGSILGSAIGGLSGGRHGSNVGTIVGMAGGAILGGAIGQQADNRERQDVHDHYQQVQENKARGINPYASNYSSPVYHSSGSYEASSYSPSTAHSNVPTYKARDFENNSTQQHHSTPIVDETNSGDDRIEF